MKPVIIINLFRSTEHSSMVAVGEASSLDSAVAARAAKAKSADRGKMPLPQKNALLPRALRLS
jgi:hypothetical protein